MNFEAIAAIENAWDYLLKARALCPWPNDSVIGQSIIASPGFYRMRGHEFTIHHSKPLTEDDVHELRQVAAFINRSFVINLAAILESYGIVPNHTTADEALPGGLETKLVKQLRHCFAHHGGAIYDSTDSMHKKAAELRELVFPGTSPFELQIDTVLEPLKNQVVEYIRAVT